MKRRVLLGAGLASTLAALGCDQSRHASARRARRVVSLSPAITETLFAIGAAADLVGVSDYCDFPAAARALPRTGTALTPNYEAIVRLGPTLILCEAAASTPRRELSALGRTRFIPWLSLEDVVASTRLLGALTAAAAEADILATKLWDNLAVAEAPHGPRLLAVLGESPGKLSEVYFIKRNSIHGAALRAAGARNAVERDVPGVPRLSLEELLRLDPEAVIVLVAGGSKRERVDDAARELRALEPLSARKNDRISVLESNAAFSEGPRILELAEQLKQSVARLFGAHPQSP